MMYFTKQEKIVIVFLALAFMSGAAVLSYRHVSALSGETRQDGSRDQLAKKVPAGSPSRPARVSVAGAVLHPGEYAAAPGEVVLDVVDRAVPLPDADIARLAGDETVTDGIRVVVPTQHSAAGMPQDGRININTAGADELDALPGIGPHLAEKIIACRTAAPFRATEDLKNVEGIGEKKFAAIRERVKTE